MTSKLTFVSMKIKNHPLLTEEVDFSLLASQRVSVDETESLTNIIGRNWINNINTIVGKNATGKTTIMKLVMGILELLLENKSITQTRLQEVLIGDQEVTFETIFYGFDRQMYLDVLSIGKDQAEWAITNEKIYKKSVTKKTSKNQLTNFDDIKFFMDRNQLDPTAAAVLSPDDSLFRSIIRVNHYQVQRVIDTLFFTDINALIYTDEEVPSEILEYLDPTIEYLRMENIGIKDGKVLYRLKFKNHDHEITNANFATLSQFLSSGTAKGVTLYQQVITALKTGGIIFIDEIENHFNHAIARTFIEYFNNPQINVNHAVLVFSTHYAEFLDEIARNDQVYVARRKDRISLTRYSDTNMRQDLSKSEVFMADNLGGTSPSYKAYIALKKATIKAIGE